MTNTGTLNVSDLACMMYVEAAHKARRPFLSIGPDNMIVTPKASLYIRVGPSYTKFKVIVREHSLQDRVQGRYKTAGEGPI